MFGYVTVNQEKLTKEQMARFRRVYCGVCSCLNEKCGGRGRFTISYDAAFLALTLNALYEPQENRSSSVCGVHPLRKQEYEVSAMTDYAADVNIILFYYSLLDGWEDDGSRIKKKCAEWLEKSFTEAAARRPEIAGIIRAELNNLKQVEKDRVTDIDTAAGCFGRLLGSVFRVKDDIWSGALYRMGDALGRFIYLMDAWTDAAKDKKSGAYNPFETILAEPDYEERVYRMLTMEMAACAEAFETLPIVQDIDIIRNVLYSGVWTKYSRKKKPPMGGEER